MKRLMIMFAAVAVGIAANAASYRWQASSGRLFDGQGSATENRYVGTGYLFNEATISQAAVIAAFISGEDLSTTFASALSTGTFSAGRANASDAFTGPDAPFNAYFVVLSKDASGNEIIYISDTMAANHQTIGEGDIKFGQQNTYSSGGFKDATAGYSSAGWYTVAPEPTSGLLMLFGMADLALRRRRA